MQNAIIVSGAREHNLKNITVVIPRDRITVITGPSGSGKSSLAMDTIYAEGQRRYVESLSAYARQFLDQMQKPEVDAIEGLSPSIAIDQKTISRSPRSTVGTITEIYDYMRVLYTRIGTPYCFQCDVGIASQDIQTIIQSVMHLPLGTKIQVLSPIVRERKGEYKKELRNMRLEGFVRARINGVMVDLTQDIPLKKQSRHTIEIVIDRFIIKYSIEKALRHAIDAALRHAETVIINVIDEARDILFSKKSACPQCGISYPELDPRLFSFNSKYGACPACRGLGVEIKMPGDGIDFLQDTFEGQDYENLKICPACHGQRLRREALNVRIANTSIGDFSSMSVAEAESFIEALELSERELAIGRRILKEVKDRLSFLQRVGLEYLTLNRPSLTLSGGEAQRIRLATQLGSSLTGVLYVLDEPSIGLHQRDCARLNESLADIRDAGNTVIIVEHDEDTILASDHVIDMGPGAGKNGGWIVSEGTPEELQKNERSLTGGYLSGLLSIVVPSERRTPQGYLSIRGASEFNLRNIDVVLPLGVLTCITGVSGSGKSTLVYEILYKELARRIAKAHARPGKHKSIEGADAIDKVISIDQSPLGRTPRSNPATYSGIFTIIRDLFSLLPDAKARGYTASRFSFNVSGGRCESCSGDGLKKIEMHFLPNVYVTCDTCKGKRYNRETLEIRYKNRTVAGVLDMTIAEAREFFDAIPPLRQRLDVLEEIGLGYLKLGQPATTLSGGEAQRLRLSKELARTATGSTLYILDEPTTGLHFVDIQRLLHVLNRLVEMGNTVIVIEHDMDVIKSADYIVDLGPEGGKKGGKLIASGTPEQVAGNKTSYTGQYLAGKLGIALKEESR
ncbi:MAG TPA: excinuclease ABC subunit UvrA [Dissulfurispiraceae bacterium]|nr:excinuclease ABC subunit UvrA [Dissulfurispiraceae bacterium]